MGKVGKLIIAAAGVAAIIIGPGAIAGAIYGALTGGALGAAAAAALTFGQVVGYGLALYGASTAFNLVASIFAPSAPKPEAGVRQVRSPVPLRNFLCGTRRLYGSLVLFVTNSGGSTVDVIAYLDGRAKAVTRVYLNDDQVTISGGFVQPTADGAYGDNKVQAGYSMGLATETAFPAVTAALPGIWTANHRGDGIVSGYLIKTPVKAKNFLDIYPQSDNVQMSIVADSWHLFDPREAGQDWGDDDTWTGPYDNPILGLLRFLVIERGEDYTTRILPVIGHWITAANICDSARALKAGGSEKLYRCAILWDASAKPAEVISEFLKTCDGWMGEDGDGHILVYAGKLYEPTVTIGSNDIVDYEIKNFVEDEDRLNEVAVTYVSDQHDYNTVEATSWRDETDIAARGRIVSTTFEPQVPSHAQSQYLARRLAAKTNAPFSGTISCKFSGRSVIGHRYINLNASEGGATFYSGMVEILTIERNPQTGGVVFTWVSVSPAIDNWIPALNEGDPAPVGDIPVLDPLGTPEITSATYDAGQIMIDVDGPDRDDLTWFTRWRIEGWTAWTEQSAEDADPGTPVLLAIGLVPADVMVEVEVAYSTGDGRVSAWSDTETVDTSTP